MFLLHREHSLRTIFIRGDGERERERERERGVFLETASNPSTTLSTWMHFNEVCPRLMNRKTVVQTGRKNAGRAD